MVQTESNPFVHFRSYWDTIRKRRELVITCIILGTSLAVVVSFAMKSVYMAQAKIKVMPDRQLVTLFPEQAQYAGGREFYSTQAIIAQSIPVLLSVIDSLQPRIEKHWFKDKRYDERLALAQLQDNIAVDRMENTSILLIRAFDNDRELASDIANNVAQAYMESRKSKKTEQTVSSFTFLAQELREMQAKLEEAEKRLDAFKREKGVTLVRGEGIEEKNLAEFHNTWLTYQQARMAKQARLDQLKKLRDTQGLKALAGALNDPTIHAIEGRIAQIEVDLAGLRHEYTDRHPRILERLSELENYKSKMEVQVKTVLDALETEVTVARVTEENARQALEDYRQLKLVADQTALELEKLNNDVETYRNMYMTLYKKLTMQTVTEDAPTESVEIIEAAQVPNRAVRPNVFLNLAIGLGGGLALGLALAFGLEFMDDSIAVIEDIEQHVGVPVLGTVPRGIKMLYDSSPKSLSAEVYRTLRTNLRFSSVDKPIRSLLITSGGAGEGKSTTVANLGMAMAQGGQKTLLIDTDLRRPVLHRYFNIERTVGITGVLADEISLEDAIQKDIFPGLSILPSGALPPNPAELLGSRRMQMLLQRLLETYDVVLFDSPPILGFSDSPMLASSVDAVLLVIEYGRYPRQMVARAKATMDNVRAKVVGAVLNNIRVERESYYYYSYPYYYKYYSYYSHYYSYGEEEETAGDAKAAQAS